MTRLAIFDLDYTLTKKGTWGRFVKMNVKGRPHVWLPLLCRTARMQWLYKQGKVERVEVKKTMMRHSMSGKPMSELRAMAEDFACAEVPDKLREGGLRALDAHRAAGDVIMLASAAVDLIVDPIARYLDIEHVVSTGTAETAEGCLSEDLSTKNCYGPEKMVRVWDYVDTHFGDRFSRQDMCVYSDSAADFDLIAAVGHGVVVNPKPKAEKKARARGLRIEDWSV